MKKEELIKYLKEQGFIRSDKVEKVFRKVDREKFVPVELKEQAYYDTPLPIPGGNTISAPHMHAICLEELNLNRGEKFLEVGAGSGILLAYAYEIIRKRKCVYGIEINKETYSFGLENLKRSGYLNKVELILGDGTLGLPSKAPFDKILLSASAPDIPPPLLRQLKNGGILLCIIGSPYGEQYLVKVIKKSENEIEKKVLMPVIFLPLKGKFGWKDGEAGI